MYPVARILLSFTRTAPTFLLRQVERLETMVAISMKYRSQDGLDISFTPGKMGPADDCGEAALSPLPPQDLHSP